MVDYKSREQRKYALFFVLVLVFVIAFVKVKGFYTLRIARIQNEIEEYKKKLLIAKSLTEKKELFSAKLRDFPLADSYQIIDRVNRFQDKYKVNIDSIKPTSIGYRYIPNVEQYLKREVDFLGFLLTVRGGFYEITDFIKAVEHSGGIVQSLRFSLIKDKLIAELKVVFVVRKKHEVNKTNKI